VVCLDARHARAALQDADQQDDFQGVRVQY
jgi:hypothetical protein